MVGSRAACTDTEVSLVAQTLQPTVSEQTVVQIHGGLGLCHFAQIAVRVSLILTGNNVEKSGNSQET